MENSISSGNSNHYLIAQLHKFSFNNLKTICWVLFIKNCFLPTNISTICLRCKRADLMYIRCIMHSTDQLGCLRMSLNCVVDCMCLLRVKALAGSASSNVSKIRRKREEEDWEMFEEKWRRKIDWLLNESDWQSWKLLSDREEGGAARGMSSMAKASLVWKWKSLCVRKGNRRRKREEIFRDNFHGNSAGAVWASRKGNEWYNESNCCGFYWGGMDGFVRRIKDADRLALD